MVEIVKSPPNDPEYQSRLQEAKKAALAKYINPKLLVKPKNDQNIEYVTKKSKGTLDGFESFNVTTQIGTEFKRESNIQLSKLTDEQIQDLAILVSQRGVVFLRNQDISIEDQLELGKKLADPTAGLHIHPLTEVGSEYGDKVSIISSEINEYYNIDPPYASWGWHSDITFEPTPSNYAILKVIHPPETGGDTLWASGYAAYDKLSAPFQKFLEGLTAHHSSFEQFSGVAEFRGRQLRTERGGKNQNISLDAVHPVVRTNPVTGWKSLFVNKQFTKRIIELSKPESDTILEQLLRVVTDNHDIQVRFRWEKNDVAIWDNRSTFHTATPDYGKSYRKGVRVVPLGETPFFDPNSKSKRESESA
ncbi:hypothetical protein HK096_003176 [Nowakowskiella sp. JEL0078]|nr:hypothetical protein HK096_003176 [Nowakowskiella sp. JEL0078]